MSRSRDEPIRMDRIYTRGGDAGETSLGSGERVPKDDARIEAAGDVDELNALLGVALTRGAPADPLRQVQNDLFDLGADLSTPDTGATLPYEPLRIIAAQVTRLETEIDALNADLDPLRSFVLPGGGGAAAALHIARTIARRAERQMVELARMEGETVSREALAYINRLSDFLFVAARWTNDKGKSDVLWVPGKNR
jgi:cob(I)alamin adenosyltransferase